MINDDFKSIISSLKKIQNFDGKIIDPKEIMSSSFNKISNTEEEAIKEANIRDYKKGKIVNIKDEDQFINNLVDDLLDRMI